MFVHYNLFIKKIIIIINIPPMPTSGVELLVVKYMIEAEVVLMVKSGTMKGDAAFVDSAGYEYVLLRSSEILSKKIMIY